MYNWIDEKWSWYKSLPWYWKVLAGVLGLGIILLLVLSLIGRKPQIDSSESDEAHNDLVDHMVEEKVKIEEDLKKEIEESKEKIAEIIKKEHKTDEEAAKINEKINKATSAEEVREILKGLSK